MDGRGEELALTTTGEAGRQREREGGASCMYPLCCVPPRPRGNRHLSSLIRVDVRVVGLSLKQKYEKSRRYSFYS